MKVWFSGCRAQGSKSLGIFVESSVMGFCKQELTSVLTSNTPTPTVRVSEVFREGFHDGA